MSATRLSIVNNQNYRQSLGLHLSIDCAALSEFLTRYFVSKSFLVSETDETSLNNLRKSGIEF